MSKKKKQQSSEPSRGRIRAEAPDRDSILKLMRKRGQPLQRKDIAEAMGVHSDDSREILRRRLLAMVNAGQLVKNRRGAYGLPERMDLVSGRVIAHRDGFGFVVPDEGGDDLYLSPRNMRRVLHGDRVLAAVTGVDRRGRKEGTVHEILERAHSVIVGRFVEESGVALVVPDNPRINQDVLVPLEHVNGARPGQIVVVALTEQPREHQPPVGRIVEILGKVGAPGMATEIAIRNFALPHEWPEGVEEEAAAFGNTVPEELTSGRKDLRSLPLVTIDGADARDFDDAVFARRQRKGWRLLVAIADVSSYVKPGSPLDAEALERGTSVYFPNRVIPMLPEALSNGLCSLRPDEDRLCLACDMTVDEEGQVTRARFVAGVMRSHARLTYNQVWAYLDGGKRGRGLDQPEVRRNIDDLFALYHVLRQARLKRGAIDFESQEVRFQFDAEGSVSGLLTAERNDAHKLIEECMILANVQAAGFVLRKKLPAPFRVHAPPPDLKVEALLQFLQEQGIRPGFREQPTPADFERIVEQVRGRPDEKLIMAVLLRSQSLAMYRADNEGHFGLALKAYSHFTSPIRRYPDLMLHRVIHRAIEAKGQSEPGQPNRVYTRAQVERLCELSSLAERRAEDASRDVDDRLKCIYMERHLGEVFEGMVSGVTSFGLFVELDLGAVNGLLHVTSLPNDYYHFDPVSHRLTGERTRRSFQLADRVKVRVTGVNVTDRNIDFELVE